MLVEYLELVRIVSPCLHHLSALRQIFRVIVCRPHFVLFAVGKLPLYPVPVIAEFIEQCGSDGAKAVHAHFVFLVAHAPERIEHGCIGNGPCLRADGGKEEFSLPGVFLKFPKNGHCLSGQGHKMLAAYFHVFRMDTPSPDLKVKFLPLGGPQFPWDG